MFEQVWALQKNKKNIIYGVLFFAVFLTVYTVLDSLNGGYRFMAESEGVWLVVLNIVVNVLMSSLSALMMNLSSAFVKFSGKEGKGSFMTSFAVFFGILTYGCTACVIAFFATIGITFSVMLLPLAGFPYKIMALVLLVIGFIWLRHEINTNQCKVKLKEQNQ
jgi:hypothetical protein